MARPVGADSEVTRQRILASALALFAGRGMGGTSIRQIARDAGVSLAMVHHYFGSKDDLYAACIQQMYRELSHVREPLLSALSAGAPLSELAERAVRTTFRFARGHQLAVRLLLRGVIEAGELDETRQREQQIPFLERATTLLGGRLGRAPDSLRLPVQSVIVLVSRYAISTERELELFTSANGSEAIQRAEDHLVAAALSLLDVPTTTLTSH